MRVRCVSAFVLELGLTIGAEYLVLGLAFEFDPNHLSTGPHVTTLRENGNPEEHEMVLFEVTDPRVSRYWQVRISEFDGRQFVELFPSALFDQLSTSDNDERSGEDKDEAYFAFLRSDTFKSTCTLLQEEYADASYDEVRASR